MGTRNQQRRVAKAKQRAKERARRDGGRHGGTSDAWRSRPRLTTREQARGLLELAAGAARKGDDAYVASVRVELAGLDAPLVDREVEGALLSLVAVLWRNGWQPFELIRHARRADARAGRLAATAVAADHAMRAASTLHPRWSAQIDALDLPLVGQGTGWIAGFAAREAVDRLTLLAAVITTLAVLGGVAPLAEILPPPGSPSGPADADLGGAVDDPVLVKVRALLAQAESTTFEAEAEAFTAKAQELMARHAIDAALLWARSERDERPVTIRLPIDDPYADIKSLLLQRVAYHSRCKAVFHADPALSSVVGFASDVAAAEVLFTSLLVQAHTALQAEGSKALPGGRTRSRSFRSSFLMSFTQRIDERLAEVNAHVESAATSEQGPSLLPALAARDSAVDDAVAAMFGTLVSNVVRGGSDAAGWVRGRMAADQAHLNFGFVDGGDAGDDAPALALGM